MITKEQAQAHKSAFQQSNAKTPAFVQTVSASVCMDYLNTIIALHERVERLAEGLHRSQRALKPFAALVFNDNGDCTISDTHTLTPPDYWNAQSAERIACTILKETTHD